MRGAANVSLSVKDIAKIEIPLPPIDEQKDLMLLMKQVDVLEEQIEHQKKLTEYVRFAILRETLE